MIDDLRNENFEVEDGLEDEDFDLPPEHHYVEIDECDEEVNCPGSTDTLDTPLPTGIRTALLMKGGMYRPRSEGDNVIGSVCPPVCPSVSALTAKLFDL